MYVVINKFVTALIIFKSSRKYVRDYSTYNTDTFGYIDVI